MTNKTGKEEMKRRVLGIHHIGEKYKAVSNKFKKDENKKGFSIDDFIAQSKKESGADNGAHSGVVVGRSKSQLTPRHATDDVGAPKGGAKSPRTASPPPPEPESKPEAAAAPAPAPAKVMDDVD